ncbi:UNVERIFIED_CONTAM: B3 domain-containing protein [Sesamum angustifolium]|uniref:B3 domain-containing protein n=1 Tax=Sesamum angustifolium TaxID=2727405 RepID=A0AAW2QR18_9LAMI
MAPSSSSSSISTLSDSAKHSSVSSTPTTTSTTALHHHIMIFGASIKKDPFKNVDQNHVGKEEDGFYFVKTTSVVLANGKRKIPQFINFFASDKTKGNQEPAIKKRKRTAVGPRYSPPPPPPTTDLGLSIGCGNWQQPVAAPADNDEDQWKIKKVLKKSDVDGSSRLLLGRSLVQEHIPPHVHMGEQGVEIKVRDVDTGSDHMLLLKLWKSKSYVFVKNWMSDFVTRRELEEKDEIGLRWNHHNSCLDFTLLKKGNS